MTDRDPSDAEHVDEENPHEPDVDLEGEESHEGGAPQQDRDEDEELTEEEKEARQEADEKEAKEERDWADDYEEDAREQENPDNHRDREPFQS